MVVPKACTYIYNMYTYIVYAAMDAKTPPWAVGTVPPCFFAGEMLSVGFMFHGLI